MYEQRKETMPCLICGRKLLRVDDDLEVQPSEAVMCTTHGNYGSTVYDPLNGEVLLFNICDPCLVTAGSHTEVRIVTHRRYLPVQTDVQIGEGRWMKSIVGAKALRDDPFVPWNATMERDDDTEYLPIDYIAGHLDELYSNDRYSWNLPKDSMLSMIEDARKDNLL